MLEFDNVRLDLESYEEPLVSLKDSLHIDALSTKISELEARTQEPDFWNDVNKAQKLQTDLRRMQQRVENYGKLVSEREDLLALCELANEEEDLDSLGELTEPHNISVSIGIKPLANSTRKNHISIFIRID